MRVRGGYVNHVRCAASTFDENYRRDGHFLDGLDERKLVFVGEVPPQFHIWISKPKVQQKPTLNPVGRQKNYPRLSKRESGSKDGMPPFLIQVL